MFTLPPRPPKDYFIADVTKNLQSSLQFTPNALPRVTQPSLAKFCSPIEYTDDEVPEKTPPEPINSVIMNKMLKDARATWVVEPGKDAFLIQDVFDKYSIVEKAADLDPRYKHKERVFNRSYKYELDCTESVRLDKLREKCERENAQFEGEYEKLINKMKAKEKPPIQLVPCKEGPPFWWKGPVPGEEKKFDVSDVKQDAQWRRTGASSDVPFVRWHEEPNLAACVEDDPCRRKYDLLSVGRDFRTEACNFYYKNYPAAAITFRPKRMDKIATENLFLLEFLVDKVELNQKCQCDAPPGETCVSFQFLDNAPLDVCEADFAPKRNYRDATDTSTKSGKSCLFSLSPDQADICLDTFDINVTIWRKMLPGWLPEKVEIGQALISIANLFAELISTVEASDGSVPTAKTLKDDFDITNDRGDNQGKITVYIRMSCFGKLIITQFQMNLGEKSVLFKDKEGKSLYRYKKAGKGGNGGGCTIRGSAGGYGGMDYPPSPYGPGPIQAQYGGMGYNSGCPTSPCGGDQYGRGNMGQGRGNMGGNMGSNPYATGNMGGNPYATGNVGGNQYGMTNQYGAAPANPNSNCPFSACGRSQPGTNGGIGENGRGSYQVGGGGTGENGSIGGNGGDPFGQRQVPCMECGSLPNPSCLLPGQGMGGPGAMESMGGGARLMTPCLECGGLPSPPCLSGGQGPVRLTPCQECGGLPNPPCGAGTCGGATPCTECAGNPNAPCLNMGPCDYCPEPPSDGKEGGDKEVFVLKIGKKKEGTDKKPRMELELITPKAPVVKPIPKLETRDTQYDSKDVNGKGKNGKGKKKKK